MTEILSLASCWCVRWSVVLCGDEELSHSSSTVDGMTDEHHSQERWFGVTPVPPDDIYQALSHYCEARTVCNILQFLQQFSCEINS